MSASVAERDHVICLSTSYSSTNVSEDDSKALITEAHAPKQGETPVTMRHRFLVSLIKMETDCGPPAPGGQIYMFDMLGNVMTRFSRFSMSLIIPYTQKLPCVGQILTVCQVMEMVSL